MGYFRGCAGCGKAFSADNRPGDFTCPVCTERMTKGFDPQVNNLVKLHHAASAVRGGVNEPYRPTYVVLARSGDAVSLRQLGLPDSPVLESTVNQLDPTERLR